MYTFTVYTVIRCKIRYWHHRRGCSGDRGIECPAGVTMRTGTASRRVRALRAVAVVVNVAGVSAYERSLDVRAKKYNSPPPSCRNVILYVRTGTHTSCAVITSRCTPCNRRSIIV